MYTHTPILRQGQQYDLETVDTSDLETVIGCV